MWSKTLPARFSVKIRRCRMGSVSRCCWLHCNSGQAVMQVVSAWVTAQSLRRYSQRDVKLLFQPSLVVYGGFLSILIPFLTSCGLCFPCVPHLSVAFYVVKSKASPEQFQRGFAVFSASLFSTRGTTRNHPRPPHEVGCHNQRKQTARREIFREERSWRKDGCGV